MSTRTLAEWIQDRAHETPADIDHCPRQGEATMGVQRAHQPTWRDEGDGWTTCSYCGSLSPESLWRAIYEHRELGPTDKNYKVYVKSVPVRGAGKFYFQHLPEEDRRRFIEVLNADLLTLGYPGHFYCLPFFTKRAE